LNREPIELIEFIGLNIDAGVIIPSLDPSVELMVPVRDEATELLLRLDKYVSALSNTLPLNIRS
jgi:hypothetical protein